MVSVSAPTSHKFSHNGRNARWALSKARSIECIGNPCFSIAPVIMTPDQPCSDLRVLPPQIAHLPLAHRHSTRGDTVRLTSQDGPYRLHRARGITEGLEPFPCRRAGRPRMSSSMGMSLWRQVVYAPPEILPKHRDKLSRLDTRRHFVRSGVKVDCPPRDINIRIEKPHLAPTRQPLSS